MPTNVYGERAAQAMTQAVEGAGGRLVGMQTYDRGADRRARRGDPARRAGRGRRGADRRRAADAAAGGADRSARPRRSRACSAPNCGRPRAISAPTSALRGAWFAAPSDALFNQFRTRYRARYNAAPYRLASLGYDAVLLAVRIAANWPIGRPFPARALRDPGGFAGVDGAFRFGRDGIAERALEVREVTATGTTVVSPAPRGFN